MRRDKENLINSQNQSMLVSERRPGQSNSFKIFQQPHACSCSNTIKNIQAKLQMMQLRLQEISSTTNICFTKHMECFSKVIDEQKKRQNLQYVVWQMKQISQTVQEKLANQQSKQLQAFHNLNQDVQSWTRTLRDMKSWKSTYGNWSSNLQKNIYDSFKGYREQIDEKFKKMYCAVEQIGLLQRRMLDKSQSFSDAKLQKSIQKSNPPPPRSRAVSYQQRQSMPVKRSSNHNDSTMLYSRYK